MIREWHVLRAIASLISGRTYENTLICRRLREFSRLLKNNAPAIDSIQATQFTESRAIQQGPTPEQIRDLTSLFRRVILSHDCVLKMCLLFDIEL